MRLLMSWRVCRRYSFAVGITGFPLVLIFSLWVNRCGSIPFRAQVEGCRAFPRSGNEDPKFIGLNPVGELAARTFARSRCPREPSGADVRWLGYALTPLVIRREPDTGTWVV